MKLSEVMALYPTPDPAFAGIVTNDDNILAIDISAEKNAAVQDYVVVQSAIEGVDAQLNAATTDKTYIRAGQSSTKTNVQRTFKATGDRYIGDEFQDYAIDTRYKVGQNAVVPFVWFNKLNGKGEKGLASIIVNSDGSGNAGNTAAIDIDLKKTGDMPLNFDYTAQGTLNAIAVTSAAGAGTGKTAVTVEPPVPAGYSALYKTGTGLTLPAYDDKIVGWTTFISGEEYDAVADDDFAVVYIDNANKAKYAGKAVVTVA
jgi:hypothetical protein